MSSPLAYERLPNGPDWWTSGSSIRNRYDHQRAIALIDNRGRAIARLDRGGAGHTDLQVIPSDWELDPGVGLVLTESQIGRITWEADRALRSALGEPGVKEWISLPEGRRGDWLAQVDLGVTDAISGRREDREANRVRTNMLNALRDALLRAGSA